MSDMLAAVGTEKLAEKATEKMVDGALNVGDKIAQGVGFNNMGEATNLFDKMTATADPTKDPYTPDQPIVYGDNGQYDPKARTPQQTLLGVATKVLSNSGTPGVAIPQTSLLPPQIAMTTNSSANAAGVPLHRQAYGKYY